MPSCSIRGRAFGCDAATNQPATPHHSDGMQLGSRRPYSTGTPITSGDDGDGGESEPSSGSSAREISSCSGATTLMLSGGGRCALSRSLSTTTTSSPGRSRRP